MKKGCLLFLTMAAFSAGLFAEQTAEPVQKVKPENMTFRQIRNSALTKEKADSIRTAKLVYLVTGKGFSSCLLLVRAKQWDRIRFDLITPKELRTTCINHEEMWGYDRKNGICYLNSEDSSEKVLDLIFLPIPFNGSSIYRDPVYKGQETIGKTDCSRYQTRLVNEVFPLEIDLWLRNKTQSLHKMEIREPEGIYTAMYRDYKVIKGVKMPTKVNISCEGGYYKLKLVFSEWNGKILDQVFEKSEEAADKTVLDVRAAAKQYLSPDESYAASTAKRTPEQSARAKQLEKIIAGLKTSILNDERELAAMKANYSQGNAVYHSFWNGWTRSVVSTSSKNPKPAAASSKNRRRNIRYENSTNLTERKFNDLNQRLVSSRIALDDAVSELNSMPGK